MRQKKLPDHIMAASHNQQHSSHWGEWARKVSHPPKSYLCTNSFSHFFWKKKKHPYAIQNGSTKCKPRQLLSSLARVIKSAKLFGFLSFKRSWKENWAEQNILLRVLRFAVLSLPWLPSLTDASNGVTHDKQAKLKGDWIPQDLGSLTVADVWPRG